MVSCRFNITS